MKGIYLINEYWRPGNLTKQESIELQKEAIHSVLEKENIFTITLNPSQINDYYTIPHALLYDLKKHRTHIDCLVIYSERAMDDFIQSYPARWVLLKSFFDDILFAENQKYTSLEGTG